MRTLSHSPLWALLVLALLLPWVSGCEDGSLNAPEIQNDLFQSYVALGNSITAGFQSGGINESTQQESYAVLLAEQMNTPFTIPTLRNPGCPPPLAQTFPPERIDEDVDCALRGPSTTSSLNNVAVPNAALLDVLSNASAASNPNPLTSFILGGQTQIQAAKRANPTFVSAWIGNNDVLEAAIMGDPTRATAPDTFQTRYANVVNELDSFESLEGAVFVGIADVTLIPHFSTGAAYRQAKQAGVLPSNFRLNECRASDSGDVLVPFRHGAALLGVAQQVQDLGETVTLNCDRDRTVEETIRQSLRDDLEETALDAISEEVKQISLLTTQEQTALEDRVSTFNQIIEDEVEADYAYVNPNPLFEDNSDQIPPFPDLFESPDQPFGPLFSLDGIHPSGAAHQLVANAIIDEIKATYDVDDGDLPSLSSSE